MNKVDDSFKQAFIAWENQAAEAWTGMLRNPDFLKQMWQSVETTMAQQRAMSQFWEQQMAAMNLPTHSKQNEIQAKLRRVEELVAALHEQVDGLLAGGANDDR